MSIQSLQIDSDQFQILLGWDDSKVYDYCYGGTRMSDRKHSIGEVQYLLSRLLREESGIKNELINSVLPELVHIDVKGLLPPSLWASRVGAGRCVLRARSESAERELLVASSGSVSDSIHDLFSRLGGALNDLGGRLVLTPDFGRFAGASDQLFRYTNHVLGIGRDNGGCGGKSSYSADGVIAALDYLFPDHIPDETVHVGAAGAMGAFVLQHLLKRARGPIAVCDPLFEVADRVHPSGTYCIPSEKSRIATPCIRRAELLVITTSGGELENSEWREIKPGSVVLLAHNLAFPGGEGGYELFRELTGRGVIVIPGQLLTLGGALVSRVEFHWRMHRKGNIFGDDIKQVAHRLIGFCVSNLMSRHVFNRYGSGFAISQDFQRLLFTSDWRSP